VVSIRLDFEGSRSESDVKAMRRLFVSAGIVGLLVGLTATRSYAQPPGTFSLPMVNASGCSVPVVNISTTEAGGTLGFDFDIAFDPNILEVQDVDTLAPATDDCQFAFNVNDPNTVSISIACTSEVFGSNPIAAITFRPVGSGSSPLTFAACSLDETDCPSTVAGSVNVSGCPVVNLSTGGQGAFGLSPGRVCISGFLTSGTPVTSASTELTFDGSKFSLPSGACFINSILDDVPGPGKTLTQTDLGPGHQRITVSGGTAAIPNGQLYGCTLTIASGQAVGPYVIDNLPSTSNAAMQLLPTAGVDGVINVTNCAGDCNGNGTVSVNEVSRASGLFLGDPLCNGSNSTQSCPNADMINTDGSVSIGEVTRSSCLFLQSTCSKTCVIN